MKSSTDKSQKDFARKLNGNTSKAKRYFANFLILFNLFATAFMSSEVLAFLLNFFVTFSQGPLFLMGLFVSLAESTLFLISQAHIVTSVFNVPLTQFFSLKKQINEEINSTRETLLSNKSHNDAQSIHMLKKSNLSLNSKLKLLQEIPTKENLLVKACRLTCKLFSSVISTGSGILLAKSVLGVFAAGALSTPVGWIICAATGLISLGAFLLYRKQQLSHAFQDLLGINKLKSKLEGVIHETQSVLSQKISMRINHKKKIHHPPLKENIHKINITLISKNRFSFHYHSPLKRNEKTSSNVIHRLRVA